MTAYQAALKASALSWSLSVNGGCVIQFEKRPIFRDPGRASVPVEADEVQPQAKAFPKFALPCILLDAQLAGEPHMPEKGNPLNVSRLIAAPCQPRVKVEASRVVRQSADDFRIKRDGMRSQLIPECRRERDDVLLAPRLRCATIAKPETHVIEKVAAAPIPDFGLSLFVLRAEEDRAAEHPEERVLKPVIMRAVGRHSPLNKNLGGTAEANDRCSVADCLGCKPQQNEPVLAVWHAVIRVSDDLEEESPVTSGVLERIRWQPADRQATEDEWPGTERDVLIVLVATSADDFDSSVPFDRGGWGRSLDQEVGKQFAGGHARMLQHGGAPVYFVPL